MANIKSIIAAHLSQRQRKINKEIERADLLDEDRLLCKIIRVDGNIDVPLRSGFIWCQEYSPSNDTNPFPAFNDKVQPREGLDVWIGKGLGGRREVLVWNNSVIIETADYTGQKYISRHHPDHEWPDYKPGPDAVNVYPRSQTQLRAYAGEGGLLTVSVAPLRYIKGGIIVVFPGKQSLDISASQPASGLARFVGVYMDFDDNTIKTVNGITTSDSPTIVPSGPVFPSEAVPSAMVRLDGDQTTLTEADFVDSRQFMDMSLHVQVNKVHYDDFSAVALQTDDDGGVGIGTVTIPHGGVGAAKLGIEGDNASADGPHIQFTTPSDDHSLLQILPFTHDNIAFSFDAYLDSGLAWKSSDVGSNFQIYKFNDKLRFTYESGVAAGGAVTWTDGIVLNISGDVGIGTDSPAARLEIADTIGTEHIRFSFSGDTSFYNTIISGYDGGNDFANVLRFSIGDASKAHNEVLNLTGDQRAGVNVMVPSASLHVDQPSTVAAIPVAYFDQADISEEMFEFATTIGTGNAIEATGLKLLTPTHFIKVTIPGGLTKYFPVGDISTTGPILFKAATVSTQGLGANPDVFAFGFYEWAVLDANLTQASTTQTFGFANISYAAHAFAVTGGAGSVDTGVVGLRVTGTSINDQGSRVTSDSETIIADITAASLDDYQETSKKWLGQVTFELFVVSGSPTTYSLDFNYGLSKYDDWGNTDFTLTDVEVVGFAGANDSDFDVKLMHHQSTGWIYAASGFTPITAANTIASLVSDHATDDQLRSSQHVSWKRDDLSEAIAGAADEGFLIFVSSAANNSIEYLNLHVGVVF